MQFLTNRNEQSLFSLRPQRDVVSGFYSGARNVATGLCLGTTICVGAPISGYFSNGGVGMINGLFVGVVGGSIMVITGGVTGCIQVFRGVFATPRALLETTYGKHWDQYKRKWRVCNLLRDKTELRALVSPTVKDRYLYDLLGVEPNVTHVALKKAYYKKAKEVHPDKNQSLDAVNTFQELSETYQILSNPVTRKAYDRNGLQTDTTLFDPQAFFNIVVGTDKFLNFIGELVIISEHQTQWEREVRCALYLAQLLDNFQDIESIATELAHGPCGQLLLGTLGSIYQGHSSTKTGQYLRLFTSGINAVRKIHSLNDIEYKQSILTVLWNTIIIDIEKTITSVCRQVLHDQSVTKCVLQTRKERMLQLGCIFTRIGCDDVEYSIHKFVSKV